MLSPAQVAQRCSTSRRSVMRAIERHELKAIRDNRNHWKVRAEDADRWADAHYTPSDHRPPYSPPTTQSDLISELAAIRTENDQLNERLAANDALIADLRGELAVLRERVKADSRLLEERANHIGDLQKRLDRAEDRVLALSASVASSERPARAELGKTRPSTLAAAMAERDRLQSIVKNLEPRQTKRRRWWPF